MTIIRDAINGVSTIGASLRKSGKERLKKEGSESVTNCHQLKLEVAYGKKHLTDVANPETYRGLF